MTTFSDATGANTTGADTTGDGATGDDDFWRALDRLAGESEIVIDRPRGSAHPRHPEIIYPFDYGYFAATRAGDNAGIDLWVGDLAERTLTAIIVTIDLFKRDSEIKVLLGCSPAAQQVILATHRQGAQSALLITRPTHGQGATRAQGDRDDRANDSAEEARHA